MTRDRTPTQHGSAVFALLAALFATLIVVLPIHLLGALSPLIREDLGFRQVGIGGAVSAFFGAAALLSLPGGRLAERLGGRGALIMGGALSAGAMLCMALFARSLRGVVLLSALAGTGNAVALPATNLVLLRGISVGRQGLAFGIKQASAPLAALAAGLSVPLIGVTVGWRWTFVIPAILLVGLAAVSASAPATHDNATGHGARGGELDTGLVPLLVLALGAGCAVAVNSSLSAHFVSSATALGVGPEQAGLAQSIGGASGVIARVMWGSALDRFRRDTFVFVAVLMAIGAAGTAALGLGLGLPMLVLATIPAFAMGWGWQGLFHLAVSRSNPTAPASASGIAMTGIRIGGIVGPVTFGLIVDHLSYPAAWLAGGVMLVVAAGFTLWGRRLVRLTVATDG